MTNILTLLFLILITLAASDAQKMRKLLKVMRAQPRLHSRTQRAGQSDLVTSATENSIVEEMQHEIQHATEEVQHEAETAPAEEDNEDLFRGFDGSQFDFQGIPGDIFNLISDTSFQLNARFVKSPIDGRSYMGVLGFKLGSSSVVLMPEMVMLNAHVVKDGLFTVQVSQGEEGMVHVDGSETAISTEGWTVVVKTVNKHGLTYLNIDCSCHSDHLHHPHGVLGQTARFLINGGRKSLRMTNLLNSSGNKPHPRSLDLSKTQGEGIVEGTLRDYKVEDGPLGTDFKFNRFGVETKMVVNLAPSRFATGAAAYVPIRTEL